MQLQLSHVSARHPAAKAGSAPVLKNLSLTVSAGESVAVIGPSGSGKTTLLQVLACAMQPAEGTYCIDQVNPWQLSAAALKRLRGRLFLAPQVPPLPPRQRVVTSVLAGRLPNQNLAQSLKSLFLPSDIPLADRCLAQFDLSEKLFERVDRLSGGERQRVGLARLLASKAELLLVDEPLSALDPARAELAIKALHDTALERGATLIASLHQVSVATAHFSRVIALREGELMFDLPSRDVSREQLRQLYSNHLHELEQPAEPADLPEIRAGTTAQIQCR